MIWQKPGGRINAELYIFIQQQCRYRLAQFYFPAFAKPEPLAVATLNKDKANGYIIYRFGTKDKTEFEYPEKSKQSWADFTYSYYMRGGGTENEGMDLNYVCFINKGFEYVIYDTYFSNGNKQTIGIKIINAHTKKTINIAGNKATRQGTLTDFRDNHLLEIGDELFD